MWEPSGYRIFRRGLMLSISGETSLVQSKHGQLLHDCTWCVNWHACSSKERLTRTYGKYIISMQRIASLKCWLSTFHSNLACVTMTTGINCTSNVRAIITIWIWYYKSDKDEYCLFTTLKRFQAHDCVLAWKNISPLSRFQKASIRFQLKSGIKQ